MDKIIQELKEKNKLSDNEALIAASILSLIVFSNMEIDDAFILINSKIRTIIQNVLTA